MRTSLYRRIAWWSEATAFIFYTVTVILCPAAGASQNVISAKVNKCCGSKEYFNVEANICEGYKDNYGGNVNGSNYWIMDKELIHDPDTEYIIQWGQYSFTPGCQSRNLTTEYITKGNNSGIDSKYSFTHHGVLLQVPRNAATGSQIAINYQANEYCVDPTSDGLIIRLCPVACSSPGDCIRKCCPLGQHLDYHGETGTGRVGKCVPSPGRELSWQLPLYKPKPPAYPLEQLAAAPALRYKSSPLIKGADCRSEFNTSSGWKFLYAQDPFKVLSNGDIAYSAFSDAEAGREMKKWSILNGTTDFSDYCYDRAYADGSERLCPLEVEVLFFCNTFSQEDESEDQEGELSESKEEDGDERGKTFDDAHYPEKLEPRLATVHRLTNVILITGTALVGVAAVIVFLTLNRSDLQALLRLCFVLSQFALLVMCSVVQFSVVGKQNESCRTVAIMYHFFGIFTICWITVMNFDLWWSFDYKSSPTLIFQKFHSRRFISYVCAALCFPLVITLVGLNMDIHNKLTSESGPTTEALESNHFCREDHNSPIRIKLGGLSSKPGYGEQRCYVAEEALATYWYGPVSFLFLLNIIFALATASSRFGQQRRRERAERPHELYSNHIFNQILIIATLAWAMDLVGWVFNVNQYSWNLFYYLEAIVLFIILVLNGPVLRKLRMKCNRSPTNHGDEVGIKYSSVPSIVELKDLKREEL